MDYKGITGSYTGPQGQTWSNAFACVLSHIRESAQNRIILNVGVWETEAQHNAYPSTPLWTQREIIFDATVDGAGACPGQVSYAVTDIDAANDKFMVTGDKTLAFSAGSEFIADSGSNDGTYTVMSVSYNSGTGKTEIICNEDVAVDTADGNLLVRKHFTNHFTTTRLNVVNINYVSKSYDFLLMNVAAFSGFTGVSV